jgi:predicted 3-demethylubiquinone-9 3-methyltransferase (glyoxalase superfamily)
MWFNTQAEEAAEFYVSIFKNSRIENVSRFPEGSPAAGSAMVVNFELDGQPVMGLNGGPEFKFTEALSFYVSCETQTEVDELWAKLTDGGEEGRCGWLKDKFGMSWQIIPNALGELMGSSDPVKAQRVMEAMLKMNKIDTAVLRQAYEGVTVP